LYIEVVIGLSVRALPTDIAGASLSDVRSCPWCAHLPRCLLLAVH